MTAFDSVHKETTASELTIIVYYVSRNSICSSWLSIRPSSVRDAIRASHNWSVRTVSLMESGLADSQLLLCKNVTKPDLTINFLILQHIIDYLSLLKALMLCHFHLLYCCLSLFLFHFVIPLNVWLIKALYTCRKVIQVVLFNCYSVQNGGIGPLIIVIHLVGWQSGKDISGALDALILQ